MQPRIILPISLFVSGIALIAAAVATGKAEVSLFIIFPVFSGSSALFVLGTVLIVLSFVVGFVMLALGQLELARFEVERQALRERPQTEKRTKYGGVVLVGPVPIAFGSDRNLAVFMLILGIVLAIVFLGILVTLG